MMILGRPGSHLYLRFEDGAQGMGQKLAKGNAPLVNISTGDYNIGLFHNQSVAGAAASGGYTAMMIQNHDA